MTPAREKRRNKIKQINKGDQKALELKQVLTVVCRIVVLGTFQTFRSQVRYEILYSALEQAVTLCQNVQLKYTWREILIKIPWPFCKKELPFLLNWTEFFLKFSNFISNFHCLNKKKKNWGLSTIDTRAKLNRASMRSVQDQLTLSNISNNFALGWWMVHTTVLPPWASVLMRLIHWNADELSRPLVGSSRKINGGLFTNSSAIASRFLCPPDISFSLVSAVSVRPRFNRISLIWKTNRKNSNAYAH